MEASSVTSSPHPAPSGEQDLRSLHDSAIIIDGSIVVEQSQEHIDRSRQGGVTAVNHTVSEPYDDLQTALRRVTKCLRWIDDNKDDLILGTSVAAIHQAKEEGKEAIIFGPQNVEMIGPDLGLIDTFYQMGIRILQLTYQRQNHVGSGCGEPHDDGLSRFGRDFVAEMDELGIVVDVSHCGEQTGLDAIEASNNPIAVTHAFSKELSPHMRAKSDDLMRALAENGGVFGITGLSPFLYYPNDPTRQPDMVRFAEHVSYVADLVGVDHVAIGLDFDETFTPAKRLELDKVGIPLGDWAWDERRAKKLDDAGHFFEVTKSLAAAGFSSEDIVKILGGNWLRLFSAVWR